MLVPALAIAAQGGEAPRPDDSSPATRHAQVIAQGIAAMPGEEIGWRVRVDRAVLPRRAVAETAPASFILASDGAVALTDERGAMLARVAPGEAVWSAPASPRAVVSLRGKPVDFYEIALVPAADLDDNEETIDHLPFAAPEGDLFDIDLIRDVLQRAEESVFTAGPAPALLLITSGAVFVQAAGGEIIEMTAGQSSQVAGEVVVTGASRAPAMFVVARIGPGLPDRVGLRDGASGPSSAVPATPVSATEPEAEGALVAADPMAEPDADGDRLTDAQETALGTNPSLADSDGDGLGDGDEAEFYGTDPLLTDTDDDGLDDAEEVAVYGTNPFLADTDGDGAADQEESAAGSNPLDGASLPPTPTPLPTATPEPVATPTDTARTDASPVPSPEADGEALPSIPGTPARSSADLDGDGLPTADEIGLYGTDPAKVDSDSDGFSDGGEIAKGTNPLDPADH